jgi:hypothetical protein
MRKVHTSSVPLLMSKAAAWFATERPARPKRPSDSCRHIGSAETNKPFPAKTRRISLCFVATRRISRCNPRCSFDYAFSPTCNSADLKGTPHPPIPQYPSGFFARYCW